ncbi:YktB family protein [Paenibacillus camelliae]|uniref:YktB family protein n=1 Tax=Paenibacillus camelliae TaxID=512410 RepID=UPI00203FB91A|nr:DUF1054 domain-containing protein [Paenibacillus camelliae]MCM3632189.1 DUF1054 domain-containing protein [Paenibacillus camelliae]
MTTTTTTGFSPKDFEVFHIPGLEERMSGIIEHIRPKFQRIGEQLAADISPAVGNEMYLHIAKHARRTVNPPNDTWLALCASKRGYKAHPHFQLGLFDDHLFVWLALIYEVPGKRNIAASFLNDLDEFIAQIPEQYVVSVDHMKKEATRASELDTEGWEKLLTRFRDVGKAELLIGQHLKPNDPIVQDEQLLIEFAASTYHQLMPLYKKACLAYA